jgi:hypothetical protein
MTETVIVQYVGFEVKSLGREYTFLVRVTSTEPREFTLTIENEAFNSRLVRFQDAPDICSLRLHNELAAAANHPTKTHYTFSEQELDEYRSSHATKSARHLYTPKPARPN